MAESTPLRLTATMLGISQRVIRMATLICGAGKPCAMSGTYHRAVKNPMTAQLVKTNASMLSTVLARRHASSSLRCARYSENVGTSALTRAPLKTPKRIVGIVAAARKVSISQRVP